jgi:MFS family permease
LYYIKSELSISKDIYYEMDTKMNRKESRLISSDFILVMIAAFGSSMVNHFFFSSLSLYSEKLTGTASFAGYLSLAYSATALITRTFSGLLSEKVGRVRIMVIGAALCAVTCFLHGLATDITIIYGFATGAIVLIMLRILNGIGMSMNTTCAGAAVPDIVPKERLAQGIGIFGLYTTLSQAVGPFIALSIIGDGELSSFRKLFFVSAIVCGISFIGGCFVKYERRNRKRLVEEQAADPLPANPQNAEQKTNDIAGLARNPSQEDIPEKSSAIRSVSKLIGPALVLVLYFFGISSVLSFLSLYAQIRGFNIQNLGWFFFVSSAGILLARLILGRIVDKRGGDIVVIPGLILIAVCLALIPLTPTLASLVCLALPYGIATGAISPSINAMMFKRSSPKQRGIVSAIYFAAVDIGITLGAPVMGWVADAVGFNPVYWLSTALVLAALLIYVLLVSEKRHSSAVSGQQSAVSSQRSERNR